MRRVFLVDTWFFILTNDHHFSQEGFEVVNDAP